MATPSRSGFRSVFPGSPGFNADFLLDTPEKPVILSPSALRNQFTPMAHRGLNMRHYPTQSASDGPLNLTAGLNCVNSSPELDSSSAFSPPTPKTSLLPGLTPPLMFSPPSVTGAAVPNPLYKNSHLQKLSKNPMFRDLQKILVQECQDVQLVPSSLLFMCGGTTDGTSQQTTLDLDQQVFSQHTAVQ